MSSRFHTIEKGKIFSESVTPLCHALTQFLHCSPIFHHDTHWFDRRLLSTLPLPLCQSHKAAAFIAPYFPDEDSCDLFSELHRSFEFTPFFEMFHFENTHSARDYMPNCDTDYSPFVVRLRETKKHEEALLSNVGKNSFVNFFWGGKSSSSAAAASASFGDKPAAAGAEGAVAATGMSSPSRNPSVAIASSGTASNTSDDSETEEEEEDDLSMSEDFDWLMLDGGNEATSNGGGCDGGDDSAAKYPEIFPGCDEVLGFKVESPREEDKAILERYCRNSRRLQPHRPYSDERGIKSIFPYIGESKRDEFLSADVREYVEKGFVFRPTSNQDMRLFDDFANSYNPANLGKRVGNASQEFTKMTEDYANNHIFY